MTSDGDAVLIIGDDLGSRAQLRRLLQHDGLVVLEAADGDAGLDRNRREHPDVVLCDLDMPGVSGFAVLETLVRETPDTPVIVLASSNAADSAVRAFKLGASDYLFKPTDPQQLRRALTQALSQGDDRHHNRQYVEELERVNSLLQQSLQRLKEDEESGRRLQFQLLPRDRQQFGPYQFSRQLWTSLYLSGDFVDYFRIDDEHSGFYLADVAGHGVSPAIITVLLKSYMNRYQELLRQGKNHGILDPAKIFARINYNMLKSNMGKHLTMFYGVISHVDNRLHYCNAGQFPYPILYDGRQAVYFEDRSKPLGLFEFAEYHTVSLQLPDRFVLTLLSDGILELLPQSNISDKLDFLTNLLSNGRITPASLGKRLGLDRAGILPDDVTLLLVIRGF